MTPQRRRTFYIPFTFAIYASFFTVLTSVDTRDPMATKQISIPRGKRRSASKRPRATEVRPRAAQARGNPEDFAEDELSALVVRGCLIARDAVFNVRDFLSDGSRLAFLAIKDCEKELDQIERKIDDQLPEAITRVGEAKARELLACLKFITDLERIGTSPTARRCNCKRGGKNCRRRIRGNWWRWLLCFVKCWSKCIRDSCSAT